MIGWNQIKQDRRAGTRQNRGRAGPGCAGQRQETVLAGLARMSELQHDNITFVDNEQ